MDRGKLMKWFTLKNMAWVLSIVILGSGLLMGKDLAALAAFVAIAAVSLEVQELKASLEKRQSERSSMEKEQNA